MGVHVGSGAHEAILNPLVKYLFMERKKLKIGTKLCGTEFAQRSRLFRNPIPNEDFRLERFYATTKLVVSSTKTKSEVETRCVI